MKRTLDGFPLLAAICLALLIGIASGAVPERYDEMSLQTGHSDANALLRVEPSMQAEAGGPPSCLGFSLGDPCITRRALGQCRAAVAQCGDDLVQVIQTCPLQFACGR